MSIFSNDKITFPQTNQARL